jgi:hypothetical protein
MLIRYCDFCGQQLGLYDSLPKATITTHEKRVSLTVKVFDITDGTDKDICQHCMFGMLRIAMPTWEHPDNPQRSQA